MKQRRQTEREELDILKKDIEEIKSLLKELLMDPDDIKLGALSKQFAYQKLAK